MQLERTNYASGAPKEASMGYSRVVKVGPFIEVGGTTSVQPDGSVYAEGDGCEQIRYVLAKQIRLVEQAGGKREDIYRLKIFCTAALDISAGRKAVAEVLGDVRPVCSMVRIHSLVRPAQVVEIELSACVGVSDGGAWEGISLRKVTIPSETAEGLSDAVSVGPFLYTVSMGVKKEEATGMENDPSAQDDLLYDRACGLIERLGGSAQDVVKIDSYGTPRYKSLRTFGGAGFYTEVFKPVKPLHTVVYVPALETEGQLVQHELFAVRGCGGGKTLPEWGNVDFRRVNIASGSPLEEKTGYSRIVKVGPFVYCGGTTSVQPDGSVACERDSMGQESYVLRKFMGLLEPLGVTAADVVQCRSYRTPDYAKYKGEDPGYYAELLKPVRPLYTGLFIERLTRPSQLMELEMNAVIGCGK